MLDLVALASHVQDRFGQVQDMSVIGEEIISILNHVWFNICLCTTNIYMAVGTFYTWLWGTFLSPTLGVLTGSCLWPASSGCELTQQLFIAII